MDQRAFNNRIALSLLRQCAWMWEHCMRSNNEGSFTIKEVRQGLPWGSRDYDKCPTGFIMFDIDYCSCWNMFDRQGIEGAKYDAENEAISMFLPYDQKGDQTLGFGCSFWAKDVFDVAYQMCSPSLLQKVRFCYKDNERWADIPDIDVKPAKKKATTKKAKPKTMATKAAKAAAQHQSSSISHQPSFAERLREALLKHYRQAA